MIICLDSFSKQILSIWVYFDLYQSFIDVDELEDGHANRTTN